MKKFCIYILIFLFIISFPMYSFAKDKDVLRQSSRYIDKGKELYQNKDFYGAVEVWTEVLKVDPWNEEVKKLIEDALGKIEELTAQLDEGFGTGWGFQLPGRCAGRLR